MANIKPFVQILNECHREIIYGDTILRLCFQWCRYFYEDLTSSGGYRFIWRKKRNDKWVLCTPRGQTRIKSIKLIKELIKQAEKEGWGDYEETAFGAQEIL